MNARQKAKKLKKKVNALKSDNDLMRRIITDSPNMQELYDTYTKPLFISHTTMRFQEFRAKRAIPPYMTDIDEIVEHIKLKAARDLFESIQDSITYNVDTESTPPTVTASIFIGVEY